jgi:hypothetical protein
LIVSFPLPPSVRAVTRVVHQLPPASRQFLCLTFTTYRVTQVDRSTVGTWLGTTLLHSATLASFGHLHGGRHRSLAVRFFPAQCLSSHFKHLLESRLVALHRRFSHEVPTCQELNPSCRPLSLWLRQHLNAGRNHGIVGQDCGVLVVLPLRKCLRIIAHSTIMGQGAQQ